MKRRVFLGSLGLLLAGFAGSRPAMAAEPDYPPVTPGRELPFAGHPTVGSAVALAGPRPAR